jgi:preprotein translocase subunit SecB
MQEVADTTPAHCPSPPRLLGAPARSEQLQMVTADMADTPNADTPLPNGEDTQPQVGMIAQYVKDLSFENPHAPGVYQWQGQPEISVQFNIGFQTVSDEVHEVILKIEVAARSGDKTAFQVELVYAGLFGMRNIPEDQVQPFLLVQAPMLLFPFARRVLADAVRDGNFPPLMIEPIDFGALYMQQQAQQGAAIDQPVGQA